MLRVVLPFCRKDAKEMADLLRWALELDPQGVQHNSLLSYEMGTKPDEVRELAEQYFKGNILENEYSTPPVPGWPAACNWAWQSAARHIDDKKINEPWFWWESDAVPLKPNWLERIHEGYLKGGRPFAGHIVDRMDHMNGVGIYPPDVRRRCQEAMLCRSAAWDYVLKETITNRCANLNHLMQHVWNIRESDGAIHNGDGHVVTFPDWAHVERYMDFNCVLLHRTKDGTLIQRLREKRESERIRIGEEQRKIVAVETNVPQFTAVESAVEAPRQKQKIGPVEIMIVTYHKDLPWFELCVRCLKKHVRGFHGITVCVPNRDKKLFRPLMIQHGFNLYGYDEVEGKGMLQHMVVMASADQIVPKNVKFVAHIDADTMFKMETTPEDYFMEEQVWNDGLGETIRGTTEPEKPIFKKISKPVYMIRTYDSLVDDKGVISDCAQWKPVVEEQIALPATHFSMCAFPFIYPIEFYEPYRRRIEKVHKKPMREYMLEGRNSFPQTRVDFQAMGQFALSTMPEKFHWIDIGIHPPIKDRHKAYWSHAGLKPDTLAEIEGFLK